jgi:ribonuclease R
LYLQQILKCIQIFYSKDKIGEAEQGDVVLVHIEDWPKRADSPFEVIKVLGKPGQHDTEIHAILAEYGLPSEFPIEVETFAQKIDTSITEGKLIVETCDTLTLLLIQKMQRILMMPYHLKKLDNGNYEIGIHIADVSYLEEGTILDDEAYQRATSGI